LGSVATWSNGIGSPDCVRGTVWSSHPLATKNIPSTITSGKFDENDGIDAMKQSPVFV
jgi:hypothetical protein